MIMAKKDYFQFLKEKQRKDPTSERAERLAKRGIKTPATDSDIEPDMRDMAGTTAGYGSTVDPETYDLAGGAAKPDTPAVDPAQKAEEQLTARKGIASGLKDLSKRGALTADLLKEARQRATKAGVSEDQFSSFMEKEGIRERGSTFSFKKPKKGTGLFDQPATGQPATGQPATGQPATGQPATDLASSPEEATQNVMFKKEFGTGLDALAAMQDPNYEVGSGSSLLKPARSIGPASGKFRRAARRLARGGDRAGAARMRLAGEMVRMGEPAIDTPAARGQRMFQKILAGREAQKQDKIMAGSKNMFNAMGIGKPKSNASIQQPKKVGKYKSPLDETRNKKPEKPKTSGKYKSPLDETRNKNPEKPKTFLYDKEGNATSLDEVRKREQGPVYYDKDGNEMMISEYQTMEFRDSNGNGIEDRSEGIYRKSDYVKKPKGPRPRGL